jgi:hypothetical protein
MNVYCLVSVVVVLVFPFCNFVDTVKPYTFIKGPSVYLNAIHIIKDNNINNMSRHKYPNATKQIHFTDIVNSTDDELKTLLADNSDIVDGLKLQTQILKQDCVI